MRGFSSSDSEKSPDEAALAATFDAGVGLIVPPPIAIDAAPAPVAKSPPDAAPAPVPKPDAAIKTPPTPTSPEVEPPQDSEAQLRTLLTSARRAKRQGDKFEALQLIDEALDIRRSTTALQLKAETLLALGDSKAALEVATALTKVASRRAQAWRIRGLAAYEQKSYADARKAFTRYIELRPNAPDASDVRALIDSL